MLPNNKKYDGSDPDYIVMYRDDHDIPDVQIVHNLRQVKILTDELTEFLAFDLDAEILVAEVLDVVDYESITGEQEDEDETEKECNVCPHCFCTEFKIDEESGLYICSNCRTQLSKDELEQY